DEEEDAAGDGVLAIALGRVTHGLLSLKAHAARALAALPWFRRAEEAPRKRRQRVEPRIVPSAEHEPEAAAHDDEEEDEGEDEPRSTLQVTQRKAPRATAKAQPRKSSSGYESPSLGLLAAAKAQERFAPSTEALQENAAALETVLGDFGVR